MLLGIDPVLTGSLLSALDRLGHGDGLVVCDANFPAHRLGRHVVEVGTDTPAAVRAVCSVLPVDPEEPIALMSVPDRDGYLPVHEQILVAAGGTDAVRLARHDFYEAARSASLIVRTQEVRPYGNVLLHRGVVPPASDPRSAPEP